MDRNTFRKIVNWVGILVSIHVIAWIIFGFFISREILLAYVDEEFGIARRIVFIFGIAVIGIASAFYAYARASRADHRKDLKTAMKETDFSVISYFKAHFLKDFLISSAHCLL